MMKADQIWKVDHLRDKIKEAAPELSHKACRSHGDTRTSSTYMLDVLAPAGYHQIQAIADAFGLDFVEKFSNEYEWDRFRRDVNVLKARMEQELQRHFELPEGLLFSLGYDSEGNFGVILHSTGTEMALPPRCSPSPGNETASSVI